MVKQSIIVIDKDGLEYGMHYDMLFNTLYCDSCGYTQSLNYMQSMLDISLDLIVYGIECDMKAHIDHHLSQPNNWDEYPTFGDFDTQLSEEY